VEWSVVLVLSRIVSVCMGYAKFSRTFLQSRGCWSCDGAVELCRLSRIEEGRISTSSCCVVIMGSLVMVVLAGAMVPDRCWHYGY